MRRLNFRSASLFALLSNGSELPFTFDRPDASNPTKTLGRSMEITIRSATADDRDAILAIYAEGIATGDATFETVTPDWEKWDAGHLPFARLVAASAGAVIGWAALSAVSARKVYSGVAEVSVYVAADARGEGVGMRLLEQLITESERNGVWTLQASVFPENRVSIAIHQKCGFREVGFRERISKLHGKWRTTVLLERRSKTIGND
jgi:L-amino acid N-acyltransferase YncA